MINTGIIFIEVDRLENRADAGNGTGPLCGITLAKLLLQKDHCLLASGVTGERVYQKRKPASSAASLLLTGTLFYLEVQCSSGMLGKSSINATFYNAMISIVAPPLKFYESFREDTGMAPQIALNNCVLGEDDLLTVACVPWYFHRCPVSAVLVY